MGRGLIKRVYMQNCTGARRVAADGLPEPAGKRVKIRSSTGTVHTLIMFGSSEEI
jgi:hypothetical protein